MQCSIFSWEKFRYLDGWPTIAKVRPKQRLHTVSREASNLIMLQIISVISIKEYIFLILPSDPYIPQVWTSVTSAVSRGQSVMLTSHNMAEVTLPTFLTPNLPHTQPSCKQTFQTLKLSHTPSPIDLAYHTQNKLKTQSSTHPNLHQPILPMSNHPQTQASTHPPFHQPSLPNTQSSTNLTFHTLNLPTREPSTYPAFYTYSLSYT